MKKAIKILSLIATLLFTVACSKDDDNGASIPLEKAKTAKSSSKQLRSFVLAVEDNTFLSERIIATIDEDTKTIRTIVPNGINISSMMPTVQVSEKATVDPKGVQDFNSPVLYTVTAEDGSTNSYQASIAIAPNTANSILSFQFLLSENPFDINVIAEIDEVAKRITFNIPNGADITALVPTIQLSDGASLSPQGAQNFEKPVTYTITAQNGSTTTYQVEGILSQKAILLAIYNESPDNSLPWDIESDDFGNWSGVTLDAEGQVVELYLGDGNIRNLSPKIGLLTYLTHLHIGKSHYTELPSEIGNLLNLTSLNIDQSSIATLPDEIGNLINLEQLSIQHGSLTVLPLQIGNLVKLTSLRLATNQLTEIPTQLGNLINLTELDLGSNQITAIPPSLGSLTNLNELHLAANQLTELPLEIGNLNNLTELNLSFNQLMTIPPEIENLTSLTHLYLSENELTEIPREIGNLTTLTHVYLNKNQLTEIPLEIGNLTKLTNFILNYNNLTELPSEIGKLTSLNRLQIWVNDLTQLPIEIGNLINLTELALDSNNLTQVPIELGNLTNLNLLFLNGNQLTTIPQVICDLEANHGTSIFTDPGVTCK